MVYLTISSRLFLETGVGCYEVGGGGSIIYDVYWRLGVFTGFHKKNVQFVLSSLLNALIGQEIHKTPNNPQIM